MRALRTEERRYLAFGGHQRYRASSPYTMYEICRKYDGGGVLLWPVARVRGRLVLCKLKKIKQVNLSLYGSTRYTCTHVTSL